LTLGWRSLPGKEGRERDLVPDLSLDPVARQQLRLFHKHLSLYRRPRLRAAAGMVVEKEVGKGLGITIRRVREREEGGLAPRLPNRYPPQLFQMPKRRRKPASPVAPRGVVRNAQHWPMKNLI
jgi:hypothetical protein